MDQEQKPPKILGEVTNIFNFSLEDENYSSFVEACRNKLEN